MKSFWMFLMILLFAFSSVVIADVPSDNGIYSYYDNVDKVPIDQYSVAVPAVFSANCDVKTDNPVPLDLTDNKLMAVSVDHSFSDSKYEVGWRSYSF